jgi:hypothetical protein
MRAGLGNRVPWHRLVKHFSASSIQWIPPPYISDTADALYKIILHILIKQND